MVISSSMVPEAAETRQPRHPNRNLARTVGLCDDRHPGHVPGLCRREGRRRDAGRWTEASASSPPSDLPPGEVEIRVAWSSVNYKDGLATRADGKVARISPLIPGIDLAGEVVASEDPAIAVGAGVLAHGYDLGVSRHGGYSEYQRVPAGWVVPLRRRTLRSRRDGDRDRRVHRGDVRGGPRGPRPVAGRRAGARDRGESGGVGGTALAILAERGYEVWAATGKPARRLG